MLKHFTKIPAPLRKGIMKRAWEIFREHYNYPSVPFKAIGRACFSWSMKLAWAEARDAAEIAEAMPVSEIMIRIRETDQPDRAVGLSSSYIGSGRELMDRMARRRRFERALACTEFFPVAA